MPVESGALVTSEARETSTRPETVLRAARLIRTGQVVELGHVLSPSMPFFPGRRFDLLTKRTVVNPGTNRRGSNEEIVFTELGQVGTQFDGFAIRRLAIGSTTASRLPTSRPAPDSASSAWNMSGP